MTSAELEVIKDIPGYRVILKAILKSQIQQLVEQLAAHTEEESVILTASVNDGTLSHLGSDSGKNFLEDHEDIKSQFLGFCLRKHHKKKQQEKEEKEQQEREEALRNLPPALSRPQPTGPGPRFSPRQRFPSPRQQGVYSMTMTRASSGGPTRMRHEPYPRPTKRPLSFDPQQTQGTPSQSPRMPTSGQVIKLEADDSDNDNVNSSAQTSSGDTTGQTFSPSNTDSSRMKREASDRDDDLNSTHSSLSNAASDLKADTDFSGLIPPSEDSSGADNQGQPGTPSSAPQTPGGSSGSGTGLDSSVSVKVEPITEMELEITGVELGSSSRGGNSQDSWGPGGAYGDESGATGSQADLQPQQGSYSAERDAILAQYQEYIQSQSEKKSSSGSPQATPPSQSPEPSDIQLPSASSGPGYSLLPSDTPSFSGISSAQLKYPKLQSDAPTPSGTSTIMSRFTALPSVSDVSKPSGSSTIPSGYTLLPSKSNAPTPGGSSLSPSSSKPLTGTPEDMMKLLTNPEYAQIVHQMSHHLKRKSKEMPCGVCGKIFPAKRDLKRHMLVHTREKPYQCELCHFSSARRDNLKCHMRNKHHIFDP